MQGEVLFRGKRLDTKEWIEGDLIHINYGKYMAIRCIVGMRGSIPKYAEFVIITETVGQLRHTNKHGRYFDGDVYCHAVFGNVTVSDLCKLQLALIHEYPDDIGEIKGNIHDNPELLNLK